MRLHQVDAAGVSTKENFVQFAPFGNIIVRAARVVLSLRSENVISASEIARFFA